MKNMCYVCGYMFSKGEEQNCPNCMPQKNKTNAASETAFNTKVLVSCIMNRFNLPMINHIEDVAWLMDQLTDFAASMHEIGGKFVINEIQEKYNLIPK